MLKGTDSVHLRSFILFSEVVVNALSLEGMLQGSLMNWLE